MTVRDFALLESNPVGTHLEVDVLVIGGGPAGCWASIRARARGATVALVDKGFCGTSGACAPSGNGVWYVKPDPTLREEALRSREQLGGKLADRRWGARVLDQTYENVHTLLEWGFPFPLGEDGRPKSGGVQGPEYMRLMRTRVLKAGVRILDHSPALELLVDDDGVAAGAVGIHRQTGDAWTIRAGAVVLASGGCAFLSKALGTDVLTGDGYLMGGEVGAEFSGMEFSTAYALTPVFGSVTKTAFYKWATFTYEDGSVIPGAGAQRGRSVIAKTLLTQPVYARLDQVPEESKASLRLGQPNFFLPFDRRGIDPFKDRFQVTLRLEGTVRGTGGLRIADSTCATTVPGLYAAGDAATRELICGGFTGGGSHNAAWAMCSGYWSGEGAADFAKQNVSLRASRTLRRTGGTALRSRGTKRFDPAAATKRVQAEVAPYDKNLFRSGAGLTDSLGRLDGLWNELRDSDAAAAPDALRAREAAAMTATARWMYRSGLDRTETRGMHKRVDHPETDEAQRHYLISGGLDDVWVRREAAPDARPETLGVAA